MRIALLCHEYPPVGGGAGVAAESFATSYARDGHEVIVYTMAFGRLTGRQIRSGVSIERIASRRSRRDMASPLEGLVWAKQCWMQLEKAHREKPFDIVDAHFIMPAGIVAERMKATFGIPYVLTAHGSDVPGYNPERLQIAHFFARHWWKRICVRSNGVITPSRDLQRLIEKRDSSISTSVVPYYFTQCMDDRTSKKNLILAAGRFIKRKRFDTLLEATSGLSRPEWEVCLVGDGPEKQILKTHSRSSQIPVRMPGWIDNLMITKYYRHAAICVLPSNQENQSVALLDAMKHGCAIVTTDAPGNLETVGSAAQIVPVGDARSMKDTLARIIDDPEMRERAGHLARQRFNEIFADRANLDKRMGMLCGSV